MAVSDAGRLSVSLVDVHKGREGEFAALLREFATLLAARGYGQVELIRDESQPLRYYAVRFWASAEAAARCHADVTVQGMTARLYRLARVTHVVNGVRPPSPDGLLIEERRALVEADRRTGFDRRVVDLGRAEGDRRSGRDRRLGPRRLRDRASDVDLVGAARRAREHAEATYSHVKVGAALEAVDGTVFSGCNIENATYGLTVCAERVAMFKALSEGFRAFARIAIVADTGLPTPPCGACRQILWEFGGNLEVTLADMHQERGRYRLKDLLPMPFDARLS